MVPLKVVELMFRNADVSRCVLTSGSVAVRLDDSPNLAQMPIYFIQGDTVRSMAFIKVSPMWAQLKTLRTGIGFAAHDGEGAAQRYPEIRIGDGRMAPADSELSFHVVDVP